jgi:small-conductance mechanosensitive channel
MKTKSIISIFTGVALAIVISACQTQTSEQEQFETRWLGKNLQEILNNIEEQFAGFSGTMVEISYRYKELYWAGQDENWEYALYQIEHIEEALEQGFMRRPEREASAQQFVNQSLPEIEAIANEGDKEAFLVSFTELAAACNTCHNMEEVEFMVVDIPKVRTSVISF